MRLSTRRLAVLWIAFLLVLLPGAFLWMLLGTSMGLRYALKQADAVLADAEVTYAKAQGSLWRGAHLEGLRIRGDAFDLSIETLDLQLDLGKLPGRRLQVQALNLGEVRLLLAEGDAEKAGGDPFPLELAALDLPVAVDVARLQVEGMRILAGTETLADIAGVEARARLREGVLEIDRLHVEEQRGTLALSGSVDSTRRYRTELAVDVHPPEPDWALALSLDGDLGALQLATPGPAALPLAITLRARDLDRGRPSWSVELRGEGIDPGPLVEGWTLGAIDLDLAGDGGPDRQRLGGTLGLQGREIRIDALELRWSAGRIELLRLDVMEEAQTLRARGVLSPSTPLHGSLEMDFANLEWPLQTPRARASGRLLLEGSLDAWDLELDSQVQVDGAHSTLVVRGLGDDAGFVFESVDAVTDLGRLQAAGHVDWSDGLAWRVDAQARRFDPSRLGSPLPGLLDAGLASAGRWTEDGPRGSLSLSDLSGALGETQVSGHVRLDAENLQRWQVDADLALGTGRFALNGGARDGIIAAQLEVMDLDPAPFGLPMAARVDGRVGLTGSAQAPQIELALDLRQLRAQGLAVADARVSGRIEATGMVDLILSAEGLDYGDTRIDTLEAVLAGSAQAHTATLRLRGAPAAIDLDAAGAWVDGVWRGRIGRADAEVRHAGRWALEDPVDLVHGAEGLELARACISGEGSGRLCVAADLPAAGDAAVGLELDALSLALLGPFLFPDGFRRLDGRVQGRVEARRSGAAWRAEAALQVPVLTLFLDPAGAEDNFLRLNDLDLDALYTEAMAEVAIRAHVGDEGRLEGRLEATPATDGWALDGRATLGMDAAGLETVLPGVEGVKGRIDADLSISGSTDAPQPEGRVSLSGFAAELVAAGIRLSDGTFSLRTDSAQRLALDGSVRSGSGTLTAEGHYDVATGGLDLRIGGEDFEAVDLTQARINVSPNLSLQYRDGAARLAGSVAIPSALIDLSRLESAVRPSADVVVLEGGMEPEAQAGLPLTARVTVNLGDDVRLRGFGLDGRLGGSLTVRETPGQAPTGQGAITVSGRFAAYGRELDIQRGRLLFSGALDNPLLDVRAERAIEDVTVGVQATGEAVAPQLGLYSRPAMAQSDILSYLVVGRPLSAVRGGEGELLTDAATALGTAGGDLLARQMGARMGLDLGVESSTELGAALTVGKYLSPRLYLGYGVSLFGSGQAVILRYLISAAWSVEVESGTEGKAALNYRLER